MTLTSEKAQTYQELASALLPSIEKALENYLTQNTEPKTLIEAIRYGVLQGGKRFRPVLLLACAQLFPQLTQTQVMPSACALELIHAYSLIHDDMPCLDNDDLRRGQPTVHKQFGQAMALLAGDALQAKAFEILAKPIEGICNNAQLKLCHQFAKAVGLGHSPQLGLVNGQALDVLSEQHPQQLSSSQQEDQLMAIHTGKTAALLQFACQAPAILAEQDTRLIETLGNWGNTLGFIFQLVDDVLDATSTADVLGKTVGKDRAQNKLTTVSLYGLEQTKQLLTKKVAESLTQIDVIQAQLEDERPQAHQNLRLIVNFLAHRAH